MRRVVRLSSSDYVGVLDAVHELAGVERLNLFGPTALRIAAGLVACYVTSVNGRALLGDADTSGDAATTTVPLKPAGALTTATATAAPGTSEFAACATIEPNAADSTAVISPSTLAPGQDATATGSGSHRVSR